MSELTTTQTHAAAASIRSGPKRFALHLGEMLLAMLLGMLVLGGAVEGALQIVGTSLSAAPTSVSAAVMAVTMTVPMVGWMHYRGHRVRDSVEMAGSMVVPTALAIGLYWLGSISAHGVMLVQHVVMIPAMVGVMLWRYEHYSR
jgi:hypothetical protein